MFEISNVQNFEMLNIWTFEILKFRTFEIKGLQSLVDHRGGRPTALGYALLEALSSSAKTHMSQVPLCRIILQASALGGTHVALHISMCSMPLRSSFQGLHVQGHSLQTYSHPILNHRAGP